MSPLTGPEQCKQRENPLHFGSTNTSEGVPAKSNVIFKYVIISSVWRKCRTQRTPSKERAFYNCCEPLFEQDMALTNAFLAMSICSFNKHIHAESQRINTCSLVSASKTKRQPGSVANSQGADAVGIMQPDNWSVGCVMEQSELREKKGLARWTVALAVLPPSYTISIFKSSVGNHPLMMFKQRIFSRSVALQLIKYISREIM